MAAKKREGKSHTIADRKQKVEYRKEQSGYDKKGIRYNHPTSPYNIRKAKKKEQGTWRAVRVE